MFTAPRMSPIVIKPDDRIRTHEDRQGTYSDRVLIVFGGLYQSRKALPRHPFPGLRSVLKGSAPIKAVIAAP